MGWSFSFEVLGPGMHAYHQPLSSEYPVMVIVEHAQILQQLLIGNDNHVCQQMGTSLTL